MLNSPYAKPPVSPSGPRPRLMLNRDDIERVKNNLSLYPSVTERWNELCASELAKVGATPDFGSYHLRDCLIIEARALKMLLEPDKAEIKQLISDLCEMLEGFHVKDGIMGARWGGHLIFIAAEVYDWCYDHLTDENKELIISFCEKTAEDYMEMGYPPSRQMAIAGHGGESQLLRDLLAFGIAVYDERPDIYDFCAGRIFDEYVSEYNLMFAAGASPQGPSYGAYRFTCMLWSELLMRPMLKAPLYAHNCKIGNHVHFINATMTGGYAEVQDYAILSGLVAIHQFCRVGRFAIISGCSAFSQDVPPFMMAEGRNGGVKMINKIGLQRAGFSSESISVIKQIFRIYYHSDLIPSKALEKIRTELPQTPEVLEFLEFCAATKKGVVPGRDNGHRN